MRDRIDLGALTRARTQCSFGLKVTTRCATIGIDKRPDLQVNVAIAGQRAEDQAADELGHISRARLDSQNTTDHSGAVGRRRSCQP